MHDKDVIIMCTLEALIKFIYYNKSQKAGRLEFQNCLNEFTRLRKNFDLRIVPLRDLDKDIIKGIDNKFIIFDDSYNLAEMDLEFEPFC
jgi:hypothetical protein